MRPLSKFPCFLALLLYQTHMIIIRLTVDNSVVLIRPPMVLFWKILLILHHDYIILLGFVWVCLQHEQQFPLWSNFILPPHHRTTKCWKSLLNVQCAVRVAEFDVVCKHMKSGQGRILAGEQRWLMLHINICVCPHWHWSPVIFNKNRSNALIYVRILDADCVNSSDGCFSDYFILFLCADVNPPVVYLVLSHP